MRCMHVVTLRVQQRLVQLRVPLLLLEVDVMEKVKALVQLRRMMKRPLV